MSSRRPSRMPSAPPKPESVFPPKVTSEADDTAMRMIPLFAHGRETLVAYVAALPALGQPLGWERFGEGVLSHLRVITADDFDAQANLVRRYVCANKAVVSILCPDGHLCSVHESRETRHW